MAEFYKTNFFANNFFWTVKFLLKFYHCRNYPDSKDHGANMGPTWVLLAPSGPHVDPMNLALRVWILLLYTCPNMS